MESTRKTIEITIDRDTFGTRVDHGLSLEEIFVCYKGIGQVMRKLRNKQKELEKIAGHKNVAPTPTDDNFFYYRVDDKKGSLYGLVVRRRNSLQFSHLKYLNKGYIVDTMMNNEFLDKGRIEKKTFWEMAALNHETQRWIEEIQKILGIKTPTPTPKEIKIT